MNTEVIELPQSNRIDDLMEKVRRLAHALGREMPTASGTTAAHPLAFHTAMERVEAEVYGR